MYADQLLPHNIDAENGILAWIIVDGGDIDNLDAKGVPGGL